MIHSLDTIPNRKRLLIQQSSLKTFPKWPSVNKKETACQQYMYRKPATIQYLHRSLPNIIANSESTAECSSALYEASRYKYVTRASSE